MALCSYYGRYRNKPNTDATFTGHSPIKTYIDYDIYSIYKVSLDYLKISISMPGTEAW